MPLLKRKPRVLVLDDDVAMQKLVSMLLKRAGNRVDVVDNGREAIDSIEGGMTVISHLRTTKPELLKRVILMTATPDPVLKGIAKEVFAVVKKPFSGDELVATVARLA